MAVPISLFKPCVNDSGSPGRSLRALNSSYAVNGKGVIFEIIFSFVILKSPCCSSDNSSHDANASPSNRVGNLRALVSSFQPLDFKQMSNRTNHSEMFPLENKMGKLICFACATDILCYRCDTHSKSRFSSIQRIQRAPTLPSCDLLLHPMCYNQCASAKCNYKYHKIILYTVTTHIRQTWQLATR